MTTRDITDFQKVEFLLNELLELLKEQQPEGAMVLALHGDLGTGKTTFTQELAKRLGVTEQVTSPTFVLMKGYELMDQPYKKLYHADVYRIDEIDEMRVLGFERLLAEKESIICIEWAEKIADMLPEDTLHLTFSLDGEKRSITITHGNKTEETEEDTRTT